MIIEANRPNKIAPTKKWIPKIYHKATPGKTAWEIASPINDMPRKIIKQPITPATMPIATAVINAFCRK